ncbi:MAG: hypothetical protein KUG68_07910 [Flavobacteriaceae bacterium]|nr:hypothetical protein [Flavobacteriaceae bacterium]
MPISIKELHIKINVQDDGQSSSPAAEMPEKKKDNVIQECIEQIMTIQNRKLER